MLALLEELGAEFELRVLNMKAGEQRQPAYLAVNPMGKVPAVLHDDVLITEQVAVYLYLADLFPGAGLAPGLGWMTKFGVVEATPVIASYVERIGSRPAVVRARERDAALAARQMPA